MGLWQALDDIKTQAAKRFCCALARKRKANGVLFFFFSFFLSFSFFKKLLFIVAPDEMTRSYADSFDTDTNGSGVINYLDRSPE